MATVSLGSNANPGGPTIATTPEKYTTVATLLEHNKPDNRDLLIKTYGDQGITGFLQLTGAVKSGGTADHVQYWEEERRHKTVVCGANDGATGGTVDLTAALTDIKAQDVVMNAASGEVFICTTDGDVFKRLDGSTSNTAWAATDELIILGNMYDQGTDQPGHFIETSPTLRTNPYMIVKDTYQVNGSQATNIGWVNVGNGDYRWYIHGEQETRARFLDRREMMMLFGEKQADAVDMSAGRFPAGSEGYFAAVNDRGIVVSNANANPLDSFGEFDNIILELDKQGAPSEYAMYVNRTQDLAIDDMLAAGIATSVTAGLAGQFGAFNNDADMAVKLGFKSFTRGGYTFHKHDWKLLNDPTLLGASTKFQGAMVPMTQVVDPVNGTKAPALELNYKEANGYSREMEHWVTGGGVLGFKTDGEDVAKFHYRSEIALVTRAANQHVIIKG
jgi:hypothetical protein